MKNIAYIFLLIVFGFALGACEKDNYEPPNALLSGKLLYQGEAIGLQYDRVSYELYQDGFGKTGPIISTFTTEGAFSQLLFNGTYKMVVPRGQGPFLWGEDIDQADTLLIHVNGETEQNIEVIPYWLIRNTTMAATANKVSANFSLEQIVTNNLARDIEHATLYVSKTSFASPETNIATAMLEGDNITNLENVALQLEVPEMVPTQDYVFARVGLKFIGVDDMIFSDIQKLTL